MLSFDNLTIRIAGREIIGGATANLPAGRRIGLVGRNGAGKSTLLKVILGQLAPDGGEVSWPRDWKIGAVAQEAPGGTDSLLDTVLAADRERTRAAACRGDGNRTARARLYLHQARRHRRLFRAGARRLDSGGSRIFGRGTAASLFGIFRRLAHARGARGHSVRQPRSSAAGRTHQLSRSRRRVVAGGFPAPLSRHGADRQP